MRRQALLIYQTGARQAVLCTARCIVLTIVCALPLGMATAEMDVYILTGQSNSLGTTALEGDLNQYAPGDHAADRQTGFLWSHVRTSSSDPNNIALIGDSVGQIATLTMQQGEGINPHFWGPEFGLARALFDAGDSNLMIIKASRGGGGNTSWVPGPHHMYNHLLDTVDVALGQLTDNGDDFAIRGFVYVQGESNNGGEAAAAETRLDSLIDSLRSHINTNYAGAASGMRTVIGEIAASGSNANRITTTNLQRALAAGDSTIAFVETHDLPLKSDNIHFGKEAKLIVGQRIAAAMQGRLVNATSFSAITEHAAATNLVFEDYVPDVNGAMDGPNLIQSGRFAGFVDGLNDQPRVGVVIEGSAERVVFADYESPRTYSVLVGGDFDFTTSELSDGFQDSGKTITLTFVDPDNVTNKAAVSGVGFRLWSSAGDNVRATFLDVDGKVLHETMALESGVPLGGMGFRAVDSFGGQERSIIHQVVLTSDTGRLWGIGNADGSRPGVSPKPDFSYTGLTIVPEPAACQLAISALAVVILLRVLGNRPQLTLFQE